MEWNDAYLYCAGDRGHVRTARAAISDPARPSSLPFRLPVYDYIRGLYTHPYTSGALYENTVSYRTRYMGIKRNDVVGLYST